LNETGYLNYEKYRGISLTKQGTSVALNIRDRHSLLAEFLRMIGIDEGIANIYAEGIEHHLHPETLKRLGKFINIIKMKNSQL
jgi:Mn-dependent DtxR family transcriptional regulator